MDAIKAATGLNGTMREEYKNHGTRKAKIRNGKSTSDVLEISDAAYRMQRENNLRATSGNDVLGITMGEKDNTVLVHFSDSAMVNRAVSRGYISINERRIELSAEEKDELLRIDKQAEAHRIEAYTNYVIQHELAVAKQQSEAWEKALGDNKDLMDIIIKISNGEKLSPQEEGYILEKAPNIYMMASSQGNGRQDGNGVPDRNIRTGSADGVSWSDFEWKTYETQMNITMDGGLKIMDITEGEVVVNR